MVKYCLQSTMLLGLSKNINHKQSYARLNVKFWSKIHENVMSGSLNDMIFVFLSHNLSNLSKKGHMMALNVIKHHIIQLRGIFIKFHKQYSNLGHENTKF